MTINLSILALLLMGMFYLGRYTCKKEYQTTFAKLEYELKKLILENLWLQDRLDYTEDKDWYNDFIDWSNR